MVRRRLLSNHFFMSDNSTFYVKGDPSVFWAFFNHIIKEF
jgi:hypothetical protein